MELVHRAKTTQSRIALDEERSIDPTAFATFTLKKGDAPPRPEGVGWVLYVAPEVTSRYKGTSFELRLTPTSIKALRDCLDVALARFEELPEK